MGVDVGDDAPPHVPPPAASEELVVRAADAVEPPPAAPADDEEDVGFDDDAPPTDDADGHADLRKRLFKHVALHCHPDKTEDSMRHGIFRRARKYLEDGETQWLLFCVARLCLMGPVLKLSESDETLARGLIAAAERTLAEQRESMLFKWQSFSENTRKNAMRATAGRARP